MRADTIGWVIIGLGLTWLAVAVVIAVLAAQRLRLAQSVVDGARTNKVLLDRSPARPLIAYPDGRIEADPALLRDLGIAGRPLRMEDLGGSGEGGLEPADVAALSDAIADARVAGANLTRKVHALHSRRVFEVRGSSAPSPEPAGSMLLWFVDISAREEEQGKLAVRLKQADSALNSLTQLIEAAPFPMWYRGPDLKLGLVNSAYVAAVEGNTAADVIARGSELVAGVGDASTALARRAVESGRVQSEIKPAIIRGERRMLKFVDVPLSGGAVAGFAVDVQDIEDARGELARHIESQRELADRMTAGTAQFGSDRTLSFFNRPFAVMTGIDPDWLAEEPEFDRLLDRMRDGHRLPETRDYPAWKMERRAWFTSAEEVIEEEWVLSAGDHWRIVAQPTPGGGLRLFIEDRTEQLRLASARDTLLRVRSATFDNLYEAISVFARDGRLSLWNRRFCVDWELDEEWLSTHPRVDELVPIMATKLVNPAAAGRLRETVSRTTNERQSSEGRVVMADERQFQYAAVPLPDGNALLTMIDVTDSSRIEAALRERASALEAADKVKTDFVANVSYELRTPLTSIGGFAEMLDAGFAGDLSDKGSEYVKAILESVERLTKLIDDVLDLTTTTSHNLSLDRELVDLSDLCALAAESVRERAERRGQTLLVNIDPTVGTINGDARRLSESLDHLLKNAIDYGATGGRVEFDASGDEGRATVRIADDGPGIAKDDIPLVFGRFSRLGRDNLRGEAALGLGLPLARQFIEAHGGTVELESAEGKGTVVTLTLPRTPA